MEALAGRVVILDRGRVKAAGTPAALRASLGAASLDEVFAEGDRRERASLAILRRECAAYFRTPAGWAVLALFLALQGIVFWMFVQFLARPDAPPGGVMEFVFGGTMLFWIALALLATVLPMRLLAEELRSGTIEPLLTAPVTAGEVVLGKWLARAGVLRGRAGRRRCSTSSTCARSARRWIPGRSRPATWARC